jgi:hypothetical protein
VRSIVLSSTGYSKVTTLALSLERLLLLSTVSTRDVVGLLAAVIFVLTIRLLLLSAVALVLVALLLLLLVMVSRD